MERNYEKDYERIMEGLTESVLEMSDEEILAEVREAGMDPEIEAQRIRDKLRQVFEKPQDQLALNPKLREANPELTLGPPKSPAAEMQRVIAQLFRAKPDDSSRLLFETFTVAQIDMFFDKVRRQGLLEANEPDHLSKRSEQTTKTPT